MSGAWNLHGCNVRAWRVVNNPPNPKTLVRLRLMKKIKLPWTMLEMVWNLWEHFLVMFANVTTKCSHGFHTISSIVQSNFIFFHQSKVYKIFRVWWIVKSIYIQQKLKKKIFSGNWYWHCNRPNLFTFDNVYYTKQMIGPIADDDVVVFSSNGNQEFITSSSTFSIAYVCFVAVDYNSKNMDLMMDKATKLLHFVARTTSNSN